jgi:hypothetical protein
VDDDFSGLVLQPVSPAIDKGITQYIATNGEPVPPSPITGFIGAAPDLGWREFGAPIFPTPTTTPIASATPLTVTPVTLTALPTVTSTLSVSATPLTASPTLTPTIAVTTAVPSATASGTATVTAQLTIQSVTPNTPVTANTTVMLTIAGTGFQDGTVVTFEGGLGLPQEVVLVQVIGSNTMQVTVTARNDGSFGTQIWDVRVTNPDTSTSVLADVFTVMPAP